MDELIYLDNAATSFPKPSVVYEEMDRVNRGMAVNAGRGSYSLAREANAVILDTKEKLRRLCNVDANRDVVIGPSITVALNQIIHGIQWKKEDFVYVSPFEHNAVVRTLFYEQKKVGFRIKQLPIDLKTFEIDLDWIKLEFAKEHPRAVFCTHISNVIGYILPVKEIFREAKKYEAITVLDTAQSLGLVPVNAKELSVDIIAFAGHKSLYGPFGVGGFINILGIELTECIVGGTGSDSLNLNMPEKGAGKYEASSSNIVAIAGLNAALSVLNIGSIYETEKMLTEYLIAGLQEIDEVKVYKVHTSEQTIGVVSFVVEGMLSEDIGTILDEEYHIAVRTGYHCAPFIHEYLRDAGTLGTVRVGIGQFTKKTEIDTLLSAIQEIVENK